MEAGEAAAGAKIFLGRSGTSMETATAERVPKEPSLQALNGDERAVKEEAESPDVWEGRASGSVRGRYLPPRRQPAEGSLRLWNVALAVTLAMAVSVVHRVIWCLQGALRQKGDSGIPGVVLSRRLAPVEEVGQISPHLPTYEEAVDAPFYDPWGAPPAYAEDGREPPPPRYEEICTTSVWTVFRPAPRTSPTDGAPTRSTSTFHALGLVLVFIWLVGAAVGVVLSQFTAIGREGSVSVGLGAALGLTLVVLAGARKVRRFREMQEQGDPTLVET